MQFLNLGRIGQEFGDVCFCGGKKIEVTGMESKVKTKSNLNTHMALGQNGTQATLLGGERSRHCIIPVSHKFDLVCLLSMKHFWISSSYTVDALITFTVTLIYVFKL